MSSCDIVVKLVSANVPCALTPSEAVTPPSPCPLALEVAP